MATYQKCSQCGAQIPAGKGFCADCGSRVFPSSPSQKARPAGDLTLTAATSPSAPPATPASPPPPATSRAAAHTSGSHGSLTDSSVDEGHYLPGTILLDRYRITGLLGRGGMGEVYRATDLKLGQQVALKFLPPAAATEAALIRFKAEVRVARQISHRNVCRVYDIGEVDGSHFLSMEYVQGEDLSSLLRRIGRIPGDKALELARQICAGVAAAHDKGVLHRDLKPSNLLIDGEGSVVIVDFGLAAAEEIRAGTPAYMAPEQLAGLEVTVRSDIYSLGLVLYELFCGRRALQATSLAQLQEQHQSTPESPSHFVRDIDPAVERVILQCLAPDPDLRPQSARAVAAALPGGDPLAAALAAGETPSPALVAAAGRETGITPVAALAAFVGCLVGLAAIWFGLAAMTDVDMKGIDKSPEIMADRARTLVRSLGYPDKPADEAWGYRPASAYLQYIRKPENAKATFPALHFFWRSSREQLVNLDPSKSGVVFGSVTSDWPPETQAGMMHLRIDPAGRLLRFQFVTPERDSASVPTLEMDWSGALKLAGFDAAQFKPAEPEWLSDGAFDQRKAWTGRDPSLSSEPIRLEAASWKGKLVYFQVVMPWTEPGRQPRAEGKGRMAAQIFGLTVLFALIGSGLFMARRNLLGGRGDRRGAMRLATLLFGVHMTSFILGADHVRGQAEIPLLGIAIAMGLLKGALLWVGYVALEPAARRRWPHALISWTRLLDGRWRDPLAGRDILVGLLGALIGAIPILAVTMFQRKQGDILNSLPGPESLDGLHILAAYSVNNAGMALLSTLATFLVLFLFRTVLRRDLLAVLVCGLLFALPTAFGISPAYLGFAMGFVVNTIAFWLAARFGLTALCVMLMVLNATLSVPATTDLNAWYAPNALAWFVLMAVVAVWAFRSALAGRPLFGQAE